jgi:hypothetical protein
MALAQELPVPEVPVPENLGELKKDVGVPTDASFLRPAYRGFLVDSSLSPLFFLSLPRLF